MPGDPLTVPGFAYYENVFTPMEEEDLLAHIAGNAVLWEQDFSRRAQRYGYRYDYNTNTVARLRPLPDWLAAWAVHLRDAGWMRTLADQATVQEYGPGAGISDHIDDRRCFGPEIVTLSLLAPCVYRLSDPKTKVTFEQLILPRSAVLLAGQARSYWKHGIPARKSDNCNGQRLLRSRRLSITFRTVNPARISQSLADGAPASDTVTAPVPPPLAE
jgi:alkylated DNA repair dioxygenase AlkB